MDDFDNDDFLGTSIQFSERQILRLEREHAAEKERIVNELIENGFLDSDYESTDYSEDSTDNEASEENECDISAVSDNDNEKSLIVEEFIENEQEEEGEMEMDVMDFNIGLMHLLEMVLSASMDFKSFLIFCIMAIALPHYMQQRGNDSDIYGAIEYENDAQTDHSAHASPHFVRKTVWVCSSATAQIKASNDDGSDNDDDDDEDDIERTLNLDIMSMTLNTVTNKMFAEFERRQFKITPNDLYQCPLHDLNVYIPQRSELPPLLLSFGAGVEFKANGGMMRVFKETLSDPISRQFLQSRGIFTLILSFAGIAAFTASNSIAVE